ncbi:NAD(P)/FAD-dependent oxidoreductase [Chloroflexota bacterium]
MTAKAELAILGGGVIGFSIAYHLAKEGVPCQVIEMDSIASKASGISEGFIGSPTSMAIFFASPHFPRGVLLPYISLCQESFTRHRQLALQLCEEGGVDIQYGEATRLFVALQEDEEKELKTLLSEAKSKGFEASWLGKDELKAVDPGLTPEARGAVLVPQDQLDSYRYVLALAQAAEAQGVGIQYRQAVGFRCQGSRVSSIILSTGEVEAEGVIIAMGPWSRQATSWLGMEIPLDTIRGQALRLKVPRRLPKYQFAYGGTSICNKVDGSVIIGYVEDRPEGFDDNPTEEAKEKMIKGAVRLFPELEESTVVEAMSGLLAYPPDALPILGRLPGWENVYIATGLGTMGITLSPVVGRIMADLIAKGKTDKVIEKLSPARFG